MYKMLPLHLISFFCIFVSLFDTRHDQYLIFLIIFCTAGLALLPVLLSVTLGLKLRDIL